MFEIYAVIATILLPTGIISLVYFINQIKSFKSNLVLWTLIFESITTILLGVFYMYSAIVLSKSSVVNDVDFVNNNIEDLAIINDTVYGAIDVPTFYEAEETKNNEIEDTRNNKNKATASEFLKKYQDLIQESINKKLQNVTREQRSLFRRLVEYARDLKNNVKMDIVENQDCFLRTFLYQALLVYSFITSALSLLNTCEVCQQCTKEEPPTNKMTTRKSENPSESFGEKIVDNVSENGVSVGPLFDVDSIGSSSPNLEVFTVRKGSQAEPPKTCTENGSNLQEDKLAWIASKCVAMLLLPALLVVILYFLMESNYGLENVEIDKQFNVFPNFTNTGSDIQIASLVQNDADDLENNTRVKELNSILRNVYKVINTFEERPDKMPTVTGEYLYRSKTSNNSTSQAEKCIGNETGLKTFDFVTFVIIFFAVIFYTKITEVKLSKTPSSRNISKCILAFLVLWAPGLTDLVASRILADKQPNTLSTLLLLIGNLNRLFSAKQNIDIHKILGGNSAFISPQQK